jgi:hypothetical protein
MVMGMVDCVGNELKVGDNVICSDMNYADLLIGEVIGFTPKKIRIKYHRSINGFDFRKDQLKHPYQVFKYEEVVRCMDCKHFTHGMAIGMCKRNPEKPIMPMPYNNYCGFGERESNA